MLYVHRFVDQHCKILLEHKAVPLISPDPKDQQTVLRQRKAKLRGINTVDHRHVVVQHMGLEESHDGSQITVVLAMCKRDNIFTKEKRWLHVLDTFHREPALPGIGISSSFRSPRVLHGPHGNPHT